MLTVCVFLLCVTLGSSLATIDTVKTKSIPITVIGGFLGSGKTTLLQNLLENDLGLRIAVIVNDVASVNVDSKLISTRNAASGMVELQNGCACCSLSEELLAGVSELVTLSDLRGESDGFDHIVVELSGVADPKSVRAKFQEAVLYDMPLMERVRLDTMVTLVDCGTFLEQLESGSAATADEAPELFYREGEEPPPMEDWMKDVPTPLLEALQAGARAYPAGATDKNSKNSVADLLVSQVETADVLMLNKVDLIEDGGRLKKIDQIVHALNPRASVIRTKFGEAPLEEVLGVAGGRGVAAAGIVDDHREYVEAVSTDKHDARHGKDIHTNGDADERIAEHSHGHDSSSHHPDDCENPDCTDPCHMHSHDQEHHSDPAGHHTHSHEHCTDPDCTDPSHDHDHDHDHDHAGDRHAGIGAFVYRARRPFHPGRLSSFLRRLPISRGLPPGTDPLVGESDNDGTPPNGVAISLSARDAMCRVLRSKGFAWCADSHQAAMYWSHAGSSFELSCLGRWWATLDRCMWPPDAIKAILQDFDDANHDEEDPSTRSVGDRRQEIVFIGPTLGANSQRESISSALDQCLLDDAEWCRYLEKRLDDGKLHALFPNPLQARVMSY